MNFKLQSFNIQLKVNKIANVHYFEFTNLYHTKNDYHNFCELLYVDKGIISVHAENYSGNLSVNQMIIHRPNEVHSLQSSDNTAPNVIIIGFDCSSEQLVKFSKQPVTLLPEHRRLLANLMSESMNTYEPPYDVPNTYCMKKREVFPFGSDQMIKILLESFLIYIIRDFNLLGNDNKNSEVSTNVNIKAVYQYICENYTAKIHLDNLCFLFGTNKTTLCRNFKNEYGVTVLGFINSLRIKEAKSLLRERHFTMIEIAEKLGFDSAHYFSRIFKKYIGLSPSEYIKSIKAKLDIKDESSHSQEYL